MLAVLLALGAAVSFGGSDYAAGLAARQADVVRVTATAEVITALLIVAVVPFALVRQGTPGSAGRTESARVDPPYLTWSAVADCPD